MEAILGPETETETETVTLPAVANKTTADTKSHTNKDNEIKKKQIHTRPYRFKYSDDMVIKLTEFSKENVDADKHEFSVAWKTFVTDDNMIDLIEKETVYLEKSGYTGTTEAITLKLYRSAKYYFIKKARREIEEAQILERLRKEAVEAKEGMEGKEKMTDTNSNKRKQPEVPDEKKEVKRRPYFKVSPKVLESMDRHINEEINEVERRKADKTEKAMLLVDPESEPATMKNVVSIRNRLKPSCMYESYCEKYAKVLQEEEARMVKECYPLGSLSSKFKKTFKNRCFTLFANSK